MRRSSWSAQISWWIWPMQSSIPVSVAVEGAEQGTPLLEVKDLTVSFRTQQGLVRAVAGVSFTINAQEIVSIVGESGCGKTVTLLSVVGLINDPNAVIGGSIKYKGRELIGMPQKDLRHVRGEEIAMIFQDPMTALTPVYTIGWQIIEQLRAHTDLSAKAARNR